MALMVKCKHCGDAHPSSMQVDEILFKTASLANNSEQCPKCEKISTYNKQDYFFKE